MIRGWLTVDQDLLGPYRYICEEGGKEIRVKFIKAFNLVRSLCACVYVCVCTESELSSGGSKLAADTMGAVASASPGGV